MSLERLIEAAQSFFPTERPDPIEWAEASVILPSSVRSTRFKCDITPWLREPIYRAAQGIWTPPSDFYLDTSVEARIITLCKPVQSGGSTFGELILLYWIRFWRGLLQYNWADNDKAKARWNSRINALINACAQVKAMRDDAILDNAGEIDFGNVYFRMQGAFAEGNLDSDSVPLQINEEIHDWEPGHLAKARNRSTAVWNYKSLDISNAGKIGGQLDQALKDGTNQTWEVKCPGCKKYHIMRTRWEDKRPDLGGLRYKADGARTGKFEYNYHKIRPTIEFWMPCGYRVHNEDLTTRRALSLGGRYTEPRNKGAELIHRSFTYEGVIVDYIDWMTLIKQKHAALRARALGDIEPWRRYTCERECIPYDPDEVPITRESATISAGLKKNREGLPEPKFRTFWLDRQQGESHKGEFPFWWMVIRDFAVDQVTGKLRSLLVYEGKLETDEQCAMVLEEHKCAPWHGGADSGDDTDHVYTFCMRYGINAIKGGKEAFYAHQNGARRIYSPERPLHAMQQRPPKFPYIQGADGKMEPDPREPMFWLYSKDGIRDLLEYVTTNTQYDTPEDVSEDYTKHQDSETHERVKHPNTGEIISRWIQHRSHNDLFVCECYCVMMALIVGIMGEQKENKPVTI